MGQAVGSNQALEILDGGSREFDAGHLLELVERNRVAGVSLLPAELGALERAGNTVQQRGNVPSVRVGFIQGASEKRSGDRARLNVHAIRESREFFGLFVVQGDV
jgi:hypothetical protein